MSASVFRTLALIVALATALSFSGCSKKQKAEEEATPTAPTVEENVLGDSDSGQALGLQTIHFPYDSFVLSSEAKNNLKSNAAILKDKTSVKIQIEGHCDQRGGIQYNIALGEKRANAVKRYLQDMGVEGSRITTISYGKERPVDGSFTEEAFSKNRRANFVITSR
ncbi:MAG: hypothetical protein A3K03_02435 [Bdellovibrionales bacterium RIFOXYD1_FULL_44_7]|nr:MAG: hypothetical protein A3K03_02435 [Bdellovibrionales bacterium RIFOXYD1_FULL_44_7]